LPCGLPGVLKRRLGARGRAGPAPGSNGRHRRATSEHRLGRAVSAGAVIGSVDVPPDRARSSADACGQPRRPRCRCRGCRCRRAGRRRCSAGSGVAGGLAAEAELQHRHAGQAGGDAEHVSTPGR
jgi:hypothetical protein